MNERLGIVVIGRNEGERLVRCLESVREHGKVMYVDSGSNDGSMARARELGVEVIELDLAAPFTAARARNVGFARLRRILPDAEYVQFVDGDTTLAPDWLEVAVRAFRANDRLAIVCGQLREQSPHGSLYNRLADMEWDAPAGDVQSCGGIFMAKVSAFHSVGGFCEDVVAGEEPELCSRLLQSGWRIVRLSDLMGGHDAAMIRFGQWWLRQMRAGYGGLYTFERCAGRKIRPFASQVRSARLWTIGWPVAVIIAAIAGGIIWGAFGAVAAGAVLSAIFPLQVCRVALRRAQRGRSMNDAVLYATFVMVGKLPQIFGQMRWLRERRKGVRPAIIEHK